MTIYCGIGSRETPAPILDLMATIGYQAAQQGFLLRSGGAPGADTAFEKGADLADGLKEIYLPWNGFQGRRADEKSTHVIMSQAALDLAAQHHPKWSACSDGARKLHARNCFQVLGPQLDRPSDFIICWTQGGLGGGGTGQALRLAKALNIPIYDLGDPAIEDRFRSSI